VADWCIICVHLLVVVNYIFERVSTDWNFCSDVHQYNLHLHDFIVICSAIGDFFWANILHDIFPTSKLTLEHNNVCTFVCICDPICFMP